jgi:hypothetical protein
MGLGSGGTNELEVGLMSNKCKLEFSEHRNMAHLYKDYYKLVEALQWYAKSEDSSISQRAKYALLNVPSK